MKKNQKSKLSPSKEKKLSRKELVKEFLVNGSTNLEEKISFLAQLPKKKFEETFELQVSVSKSKNHIPSKVTVTYPNSFGPQARILVLCEEQYQEAALKYGADYSGLDNYVKQILESEWLDFDVVIATPAVMPKIARLGKVLGTKGLMPNPKSGTVTTDLEKSIKEFKAGKKVYKEDKNGTIHISFGKTSMTKDMVIQNLQEAINQVKTIPNFENIFNSASIKITMSPSLKLELSDFQK